MKLRRIAFLTATLTSVLTAVPLCAQEWYAASRPCDVRPVRWLSDCGCARPQPPPITFSADILVLDRDDVDSRDFLFTVVGGTPVLSTGDVDQPTAFSSRYSLVFYDSSGWDLELELLGFPDDRDDWEVRSDAGTLTFDWYGGGPITPATSYTVEYESRLRGGAVNLRWRRCPWLTLYSGLRYLGLHENFDILDTATIGTATTEGVFSSTTNDLYGGQVGADFLAFTFRGCRLSVTGAFGSYANRMTVYAVADDGASNPLILDRRNTSASFVSEARAMLEIPCYGPGAMRIGYQAYWLGDVLLATDQSDDFDILTNTGTFDFSSPLYQGGFVGLEFWF